MSDLVTSRERVLNAINLQKSDRVPCALNLSYFAARYNGVSIADFINTPGLYIELKEKTFEALGGSDMISLQPPCHSGSPDNFAHLPVRVKLPGQELPSNAVPQYDEAELMVPDDYPIVIDKGWFRFVKEHLVPRVLPDSPQPDAVTVKREDPYREQGRRYFEERDIFIYPSNLISLPFEVLSYARSMEKFMVDLYRRPEAVLAAMDVIMLDLVEDTLLKINDSTETVLIPANRFSSGFISPRFFEKFAFPQFLEMVTMMANRGITVFFHFDQDWTKVLPYFLELPPGKYVFHFDSMTDIFKAKEVLGHRMCFMGDVPARLFKLGTPQDIEDYCKKLIDKVGHGGGFILGAGCEEPDGARFENVKAMLDVAKTYCP